MARFFLTDYAELHAQILTFSQEESFSVAEHHNKEHRPALGRVSNFTTVTFSKPMVLQNATKHGIPQKILTKQDFLRDEQSPTEKVNDRSFSLITFSQRWRVRS
jgi:hypothetical protein